VTARCRVFYDGLDHPECVAVHRDGSVWCGGEAGQVYRIEPDGSAAEQVASTGGFCLGLAFDAADELLVCDMKQAAVFRVSGQTGRVTRFAEGAGGRRLRIPNFPVVDAAGRVYISDSHAFGEPGPGVFRFGPDGEGELWYGEPAAFANGLALAPDGGSLYVVESFGPGIFRIPILPDGSAGAREEVLRLPGTVPDGVAFGPDGLLYVGCYEPSQVLRLGAGGELEVVASDPIAHMLCHPTNVAFRGSTLFAANLGRWHVTAIDMAIITDL
jgi:gluconolactonase